MEQPKHSIIVLHGMDDAEANAQSNLLFRNIAMHFQKENVLPFGEHFQLVHIGWQSIVQEAETAIFAKSFPRYKVSRHNTFWDAFTPDQTIRNFMTFFIGDIIAYSAGNNNGVRASVWQQMQPVCLQGTYSIVAHSLGSVIAFDYLYKLFNTHVLLTEDKETFRRTETDPATQPYKQNFHHLFTLGSPLALFTLRQQSLWSDAEKMYVGLRNPVVRAERYHPLPEGIKRVWMNFYDKKDYIAYPLRELFSTNPLYRQEPDAMPIDEVVQTGDSAADAHSGYWADQKVAASIAEILLQTLKAQETYQNYLLQS